MDYDGDGNIDVFLADNGAQGGMSLYHNLGNGKFEDVTRKGGLDPNLHGVGCTAGDYDNDGATDLAVSFTGRVTLLHNQKNGIFKDVTEAAGIKSEVQDAGLTFIDYDHDGDIDLLVTRPTSRSQGRYPENRPVRMRCGVTTATVLLRTLLNPLASKVRHPTFLQSVLITTMIAPWTL